MVNIFTDLQCLHSRQSAALILPLLAALLLRARYAASLLRCIYMAISRLALNPLLASIQGIT